LIRAELDNQLASNASRKTKYCRYKKTLMAILGVCHRYRSHSCFVIQQRSRNAAFACELISQFQQVQMSMLYFLWDWHALKKHRLSYILYCAVSAVFVRREYNGIKKLYNVENCINAGARGRNRTGTPCGGGF